MKKILMFIFTGFALLGLNLSIYAHENNYNVNYYLGDYDGEILKFNNIEKEINIEQKSIYKIEGYYTYTFYMMNPLDLNNGTVNLYEVKFIPKEANYKTQGNIQLNKSHLMEVIFINEDEMSIVYVSLQQNLFAEIENLSINIDLRSEHELESCLKESLGIEFYYKSKINTSSNNASTYAFGDSNFTPTIDDGLGGSSSNYVSHSVNGDYSETLQSITSSDAMLDQYCQSSLYRMGNSFDVSDKEGITDNQIVYLIPKDYFRNTGVWTYVGTEYGFYINTIQDYGNDTISKFIIFDIETQKKSIGKNGIISVKPLLNGNANYQYEFDLVTCEGYNCNNLALSNIKVSVDLKNQNELNIGDAGYTSSNDYGYVISSFSIAGKGCPSNRNEQINLSYVKYGARALKNIPKYGIFINLAIQGALNVYENAYNSNILNKYDNFIIDEDGCFNTNLFNINPFTDLDLMAQNYGNLVKGIEAELTSDNTDGSIDESEPLLYKVEKDNYFKFEYNCIKRNTDVNWDATITNFIKLDIVEDNSGNFIFPYGSVDFMKTASGGWSDSYNDRPTQKTTTISPDNIYYAEFWQNSYQEFLFTPQRTGNYVFETFGTDTDTIIELCADGSSNVTTADDGGSYLNNNGSRFCSKLSINLQANTLYRIKVKGYRDTYGTCNFFVRRQESNISEITTNYTGYTSYTYYENAIWQTFTPTRTDYYKITNISSNSIDTCIEVYDGNFSRLAFDDDSGHGSYADVNVYLMAGKTYYIKTMPYTNNSISKTFATVILNTQKIHVIDEMSSFVNFFELEEGQTNAQFFVYDTTFSQTYTVWTSLFSGYDDLYLYVLDENFNLVASDDDDGEGYQPEVTITLQANKRYYFMIKQLFPNDGETTEAYFHMNYS